jgi:O-antigen ligase
LADHRSVGPLLRQLRAAPATVPAAVAVAVMVAWAQADGGQPLSAWAPGALAILGLLAVALVTLPGRVRDAPVAVRVALALLAAFTAWSALSIAWADDQGAAWEGTARTLLYLVVFALFALWPQHPRTAAWLLGAWVLALGVLAAITLLRMPGLGSPSSLFIDDRLDEPAGYPNAAAAMWLMPLWPAVALAASERVPWLLRGAFAACAVVFADVALLSLSRGSLFAVPITAVLFLACVPGRLRHVAVLVPVGIAAGLGATAALDVGPALLSHDAARIQDAIDTTVRPVLLLALAAGAVVAVAAALERLRPPAPRTAARIRRGWTAVVAAGAVAVVAGGLVAAGDPVQRLQNGWDSFKGGYGESSGGSRLTSGLGSNRYDFYRVSLNLFADHPVAGVGADNFFQDYLAHGRSEETPRYPHSLELRTLSQTGVIGAALLLGALLAALAAAWHAMRGADPLARAVAGGGATAFAYWVVHGSADWFWEWAGLGAPAFAFLGLACALAPRRATVATTAPLARGRLAVGAVALGAVAAAFVVAAPWLADRDVNAAARVFDRRPFEAYDRLDRAASVFGASDRALLVKGSIALRYGDLPRADAAFSEALARNARGQYATLELGAIASARGDRPRALRLLQRSVALAPRDRTAREALAAVRGGGAVDLTELNRRILRAGQELG